ncbi:MAG: hypothetical protein RI949_615, partial [Pseudomonadota bacterium]
RHDGKTEGYSFASIDEAYSAGVTGSRWAVWHPREEWSLAWAMNRLSTPHQRYLAAGGMDFFLGDGALRYAQEMIWEAMYTVPVTPLLRASLNFQHVRHPGYNQDRGPVNLAALRIHLEF